MSFIVLPLAYIDIAIRMKESTDTLGLSIDELTIIRALIREIKLANPMPLTSQPLPIIIKIFGQLIGSEDKRSILVDKLRRLEPLINRVLQFDQRTRQLVQRHGTAGSVVLDYGLVLGCFHLQIGEGIVEFVDCCPFELLVIAVWTLLATATAHLQIIIRYLDVSRDGNFIIRIQISMEQLNRLIKDASNEFECHNFQTSLSLYRRCIERCISDKLPSYVLNNLKSSQAALRTILGEYETALTILNQVLSEDKQHWLSLIRRSQVYKKQNKLKKAMKDLDVLTMYAPDNMQVVALKLEIKGMMSKPNGSSSSSSQDEEKIDEEEVLQFSNLRKIDRCSVSIMIPKGRQSRVSMGADKFFTYESNSDPKERARQSKSYTPSFNCKRFIQIDKELEQTVGSQKQLPAVVIKAKPARGKSILKNRASQLYVVDKLDPETMNQQKKLLEKVHDIDGHMITSVSNFQSSKTCSQREVNFKKCGEEEIADKIEIKPKRPKQSGGRKSCLKRSSFSSAIEEVVEKKAAPRRSKFETMSRSSIDGKILKSDKKKKQVDMEASKENIQQQGPNNNESDNESEEGSQYNIFGSKKVVLNQELRENLGLGSDSIVEESESSKKAKPPRGQSILKKTSIIVKKDAPKKKVSVFFREQQQKKQPQRKAKKSVMFKS